MGISDAKIVLGLSIALTCGALEPFDGLGLVLRHAVSRGIRDRQIVLRLGIATFGRKRNSVAASAKSWGTPCPFAYIDAEIVVRRDITLGCRETIPFEGLGIILSDASTMIIADAEIELRVCVTLLRCAPIPFTASA